MNKFIKNLFNKPTADSRIVRTDDNHQHVTDTASQRQKFIRWIQYNNTFGPDAEIVSHVIKDLDKAISKPTHHFEWRIGATLTRAGVPHILKWIDNAFQVFEVDEKLFNELKVSDSSITFVEFEKKRKDTILSALTYQKQATLQNVCLPHPYQLNGYRPVLGFIEIQSPKPLNKNNIVLVMEHELYYAARHVTVAKYFYPDVIKSKPSGQATINFKFPHLNSDDYKLQGLFYLTFKLMDKANSKDVKDWILISNTLSHSVEVL